MKQNLYIERKSQRQNKQGIEGAASELNQIIIWKHTNFINCQIATISQELSVNIESQGLGRDGPPGCSLNLKNSKSIKINEVKTINKNKNQLFTNNYYLQS